MPNITQINNKQDFKKIVEDFKIYNPGRIVLLEQAKEHAKNLSKEISKFDVVLGEKLQAVADGYAVAIGGLQGVDEQIKGRGEAKDASKP